jgi:hypothetical protein
MIAREFGDARTSNFLGVHNSTMCDILVIRACRAWRTLHARVHDMREPTQSVLCERNVRQTDVYSNPTLNSKYEQAKLKHCISL